MGFISLSIVVAATAAWQWLHRTAPLVRRWQPSSFPRRSAGSLSVRDSGPTGGRNDEVVLLLHGLGATGDYFGDHYDGLSRHRRVVIVDLLGFGRSLDEGRSDFGVAAHVDALDTALDSLGLADSKVVLAAHSMSSAIALSWAVRHPQRVVRVCLWGPPIYPAGAAARSIGKDYGPMARLFALDTKWAERACRLNCSNRDISGRIMALMAPRWPTRIGRDAALHTWSAYHGSLRALILEFDWSTVLPAAVPVTVVRGSDDPIGDHGHLGKLAGGASVVDVDGADHHVALQHPQLLAEVLDATPGE